MTAIRLLTIDDVPALAALHRENREFLAPWEPVRDEEYYTEDGYRADGHPVQDGIAYTALDQPAYGYSYSVCPAGSTLPASSCIQWIFLDANTGELIDWVLALPGNSHVPKVLPTAPRG